MKKLIGEFGAAPERAQAGLLSIKTTGTELSGVLAERIEKGRAMADELRFINEAANKVADKLDRAIGEGRAIAYPVAVGRAGKSWTGAARVQDKQANPAWIPPAEVKRDNPNLPDLIPGGAPNNPMGPRVLVLDRAEIAIHGTTAAMRKSIGSAASYGCIRMYNEDIVDLFDRVRVGTPVVAIG